MGKGIIDLGIVQTLPHQNGSIAISESQNAQTRVCHTSHDQQSQTGLVQKDYLFNGSSVQRTRHTRPSRPMSIAIIHIQFICPCAIHISHSCNTRGKRNEDDLENVGMTHCLGMRAYHTILVTGIMTSVSFISNLGPGAVTKT